MKHLPLAAASALFLAGCQTSEPEANAVIEAPVQTAEEPAYDYTPIFEQEGRPEGDYEQYEIRKAPDVIAFTGVLPGMTVVDLEAGGGVYTELFSVIVGEEGKVFLQNPPEFDSFLGDSVERRMDGRLENVVHIKTSFDDLEPVGDEQADLVTWFLGPHELWYTPEGAKEGALGDPETTFLEISRILKPGGHFIVLDHAAPPGSPATTGGDTHRLAKDIVVSMAVDVGLVLVEESPVLTNPEDDGTVNVFDPSIRRNTDRYLLKFEKPGS